MLSIRTQDRMALVPYKNSINVIKYNTDGWSIYTYEHTGMVILGTYDSEARALQVLDEISKATIGKLIINNPMINNEHWTNEYITYVSKGSQEQIIPLPVVYQMPKE